MYTERSKGIQPAELSYSTTLLNDAQQNMSMFSNK